MILNLYYRRKHGDGDFFNCKPIIVRLKDLDDKKCVLRLKTRKIEVASE